MSETQPQTEHIEHSAGLATAALIEDEETIFSGQISMDVDQVEIKTRQSEVNVLYMSELLTGNYASNPAFYEEVISTIPKLPNKPDVIVLSGFLQGDFKQLESGRRPTLKQDLSTMGAQFKRAKELIDKATETGIPVIYNMGDDDRRIAKDYTFEFLNSTVRRAKEEQREVKAAQSRGDADKKAPADDPHIPYYDINKLQRNTAFQKHYLFQVDVVFPYCLRSGRRLRTATEMAAVSGETIQEEEYLVLFDTYQKLAAGERPNPNYVKFLDMDNLGARGEKKLRVTDDLNLHLKTKGKEYTDWVRHVWNFSAQPKYQNFMDKRSKVIGEMAANGADLPDMLVTQNDMEMVGVVEPHVGGETWISSTGGMITPIESMQKRGYVTTAAGDPSRRTIMTRTRVPSPTAEMHTRTDDGRHIVTIFNKALNDKSESIPERLSIAELCDWQTGSITARADMLVTYFDYIRTRLLGNNAVALFLGGDQLHGRNYSDFPNESQRTGLMSMDSQEDVNIELLRGAFGDISREELMGLVRTVVQIGNHEWNSGTQKWHGYSFSRYLRQEFEAMYMLGGFSREEAKDRVRFHNAVRTPGGDYVKSFTGIEKFGEIGVLIQHFLLERGGKGQGGGLPVYQAHNYISGAGDYMKNIDVFMAGHWHHSQYAALQNKLAIVGGSMAGMSGYELWRGYRPAISGTVLHIGGGLPAQIEFVPEQALLKHKIGRGRFTDANLKSEGYKTDRGFDAGRHGIMLPDDTFPKSALQKAVLRIMREASQGTRTLAEL